ncbi:hypothetical protein ACQPXM_07525 [Kribbella sp. CA-253562]|uniref:hypothetical protein n=1 Tax=Kribbella sp. CA-253562 TaxID=3239942 RepID=UPI003D8CB300
MNIITRFAAPLALAVAATGVTALPASAAVPAPPARVLVKGTFTGVDLSWALPAEDATADAVTGFVVHRTANGTDTTFAVPRTEAATYRWVDSQVIAGATYAVSAVSADGEGASSTPAAVGPVTNAIAVVNTVQQADGSTRTYLGQLASQGAQQVVPLATSGPTQQVDPYIAVAPDGARVVFGQAQNSLWVVSGLTPQAQPVRILANSSGIGRKAWSPDGTKIAFERVLSTGESCLEVIGAQGGTPVRVGCGLAGVAWLLDNRTLVTKELTQGRLQQVEARANGAVLKSYPGTELAREVDVSGNGRWIAYLKGTSAAVVPVDGGTPFVGPPIGASAESLSWAEAGTELLVTRQLEQGSVIHVVPVSAEGRITVNSLHYSAPAGEVVRDAIWQGPRVTIGQGPVGPDLSVPFGVTGLTPADIACELDGVRTDHCTSPFRQSGVTAGRHLFRVIVWKAGGLGSTSSYRYLDVDATAPTASLTGPTFAVTKAATAAVTYAGADASGIGSFDVRYRTAAYLGTFGAYITAASATKATSTTLNLVAGNEYCVSVRSRDNAGNVSGWTAERCFSRPLDDRAMTTVGQWTRAGSAAYYAGTVTTTGTKGAALTRTVQGKHLYVVATRCATCGTLQVYYGGRSVGAVSLYKATTEYQAVLALPTPAAFLSGTVQLTVRDAGKTNQIDGLAVRKT